MTSSRHGDGSCDVALSALVRRSSLTIPRSEEPPLPVAVCSAGGVPGEFVRRWPNALAARCRGTTRGFGALYNTPAGQRRGSAGDSLLTALIGARDTAGAPSIFVSRRNYS